MFSRPVPTRAAPSASSIPSEKESYSSTMTSPILFHTVWGIWPDCMLAANDSGRAKNTLECSALWGCQTFFDFNHSALHSMLGQSPRGIQWQKAWLCCSSSTVEGTRISTQLDFLTSRSQIHATMCPTSVFPVPGGRTISALFRLRSRLNAPATATFW